MLNVGCTCMNTVVKLCVCEALYLVLYLPSAVQQLCVCVYVRSYYNIR